MWLPAKTPRDIINKLHQETVKALRDPAVQEKLTKMGVEEMILTPEEFDKRVAQEVAVAAELAKAVGIAVK
jgi:tripartite-type tricarboxylate transporter receptor subunit TctC